MRKTIHPLFLVFGLLLAAGGSGCGGKSDPAAPPGARVTVESSRQATRSIGPDGGVLTTTSTSGVTFTLEIPAFALPADVEISMTPVAAIADLPWSGGLAAAVQLEPSGLTLIRPAMLTVANAAPPGVGQQMVGFNYEGDAAAFELTVAALGGGAIRVPVPHFSGAGAAAATPEEVDDSACERPGFRDRLRCIALDNTNIRERFLLAARASLNDVVVPAVRGDGGYPLRDAVIDEYLDWYDLMRGFAVYFEAPDWEDVLAEDLNAADELVIERLRDSIAAHKQQLCTGARDLETLIAIFELNWLAKATAFDIEEHGLAESQVLDGLCAEVIVERFDLPEPLPVGVDVSADVDLRLDLGGVPVEVPFQVQVYGQVECAGPVAACEGRSDAAGVFTAVVRRVDDSQNYLWLTARPVLPLFSPEGGLTLATVPIFGLASLFRGSSGTLTDFPSVVTPGTPASFGVAVVREVSEDVFAPLPNVLVTCAVDGGQADPVVAITDGDGVARTMITADAGVDSIIVRFSVSDNGVVLSRGRAAALVVSDGGTITLIERISGSYASTADVGNCPPQSDPHWETTSGFVTLSAGVGQTCTPEDPDIDDRTATASSFVSQSSDTGIAADGRSAVMTFSATGTSQASATNTTARTYYSADFDVHFEIQGGPMTFQLDAMVDASIRGGMQITLQTADGDVLYDWDHSVGDEGPSSILVAGNLPPGRYRGQVRVQGNATANVWASSFCSGQATLTLNQATATP